MDRDVAIKVENISKKYCKSLNRSMFYGITDIVRNMFGLSSRSERLRSKEFWAIKDITLEVKKGETLGLIGPNGSGKTTLLKMLSGIFWPDKGKIAIKGKVGALIAVGAGFHPMLTGRENIYVNGAILGMGKHEIDKKFDSIVEFADIGDFLDTPVKYYSSGMFVRLGFAIAVHCEPDILLVDEILAVGDMPFRTKCLDKMKEFVDKGKTIIFVSHQLHQVEKLCDRVILLMNGQAIFEGNPNDAIDLYRSKVFTSKNNKKEKIGSGEIIVTKVELINESGKITNEFEIGECVTIRIHYHAKEKIKNPIFIVAIYPADGEVISEIRTDSDYVQLGYIEDSGYIDLKFNALNLLPNSYIFSVNIHKEGGIAYFDRNFRAFDFCIKGGHKVNGVCYFKHEWNLNGGIQSIIKV